MRRYPLWGARQSLSFADRVLRHFDRHRQTRFWHTEAGGLLFAQFEGPSIIVDLATGPRPLDLRSRCSYWPDWKSEQREIDESHALGLHFVGTWHTHPEDAPAPSGVDLRSIADVFKRSRHALNGFVMVIVGRKPDGADLYVGVWDGVTMHQLRALDDPPAHCAAGPS